MPKTDANREYVMNGIYHGFRITNIDDGGLCARQANHPSAYSEANKCAVEEQIKTEIENGRYVITNKPPNIISALAAIPKQDSNDVRLIHDASRPHGASINDYAEGQSYTCSTVQTAAGLVNRGAYMGKIDLSSAYRSVKIHPDDYSRAGIAWTFQGEVRETYMYDTRLMFGARMSACIFNLLTKCVIGMLEARGHIGKYIVYCDDFFITDSTEKGCRHLMNELVVLLRELGFAINYKKMVGPATSITFLGVVIDSVKYTLSLPSKKLRDLVTALQNARKKRSITHRCLQSLCGRMNWASQVIYGGRVYMRRMLDAIAVSRKPTHHVRVSGEMRRDLTWWMQVATSFNGTMAILDDRPTTPLTTDACLVGGGGHYLGEWYYVPFREWPGVNDLSINYKEVLAVLPACQMWGKKFSNRRVALHMDNISAVHIINRGTSKHPLVQQYLREINALSVRFNFRLTPIYYPGTRNIIADSASRLESPGGMERLEAALATAAVDPMVHHQTNNKTYRDTAVQNERSGTNGPCTGLPSPGLRSQYPEGVRQSSTEIHNVLRAHGSGTSAGHYTPDMPVCSPVGRDGQVQHNKTIYQRCANTTSRMGSQQSIGKQLSINNDLERSAPSVGRLVYKKRTSGSPVPNATFQEPASGHATRSISLGSSPNDVLRAAKEIERDTNRNPYVRFKTAPATTGYYIYKNRHNNHSAMVQNKSVQGTGANNTLTTNSSTPIMPSSSGVSRYPLDPGGESRGTNVYRPGTRPATTPPNGGHILEYDKARFDHSRCKPQRIREPLFQEGRLVLAF